MLCFYLMDLLSRKLCTMQFIGSSLLRKRKYQFRKVETMSIAV